MNNKERDRVATETLFEIIGKTNGLSFEQRGVLAVFEFFAVLMFGSITWFVEDYGVIIWLIAMGGFISYIVNAHMSKWTHLLFEKKSPIIARLRYIPIDQKIIYRYQFKCFMELYCKRILPIVAIGTVFKFLVENLTFNIKTELIALVLTMGWSFVCGLLTILAERK